MAGSHRGGEAGGSAILVCAPEDRQPTCPAVGVADDVDAINVLCVSIDGDPESRLRAIREWGVTLERTGVVSVETDEAVPPDPDCSYSIDVIEDVDQLSALGTNVRDTLNEWAEGEVPTVLCFDSVTSLLQRADMDLTFEFLLVLTESIRGSGAVSHFHYDPATQQGADRRTLEHVFDHVVEAGGSE